MQKAARPRATRPRERVTAPPIGNPFPQLLVVSGDRLVDASVDALVDVPVDGLIDGLIDMPVDVPVGVLVDALVDVLAC